MPPSEQLVKESREVSLPQERKENDAKMVVVLEYFAWGRHYGTCYPHRACSCPSHRSPSETISISSVPKTTSRSHEFLLINWNILPPPRDAREIIQFHAKHLIWHHNCLHTPTFTEQCGFFWSSGTTNHPLWMASYLAVMSMSSRLILFWLTI
jgi:hypothetical protein